MNSQRKGSLESVDYAFLGRILDWAGLFTQVGIRNRRCKRWIMHSSAGH